MNFGGKAHAYAKHKSSLYYNFTPHHGDWLGDKPMTQSEQWVFGEESWKETIVFSFSEVNPERM